MVKPHVFLSLPLNCIFETVFSEAKIRATDWQQHRKLKFQPIHVGRPSPGQLLWEVMGVASPAQRSWSAFRPFVLQFSLLLPYYLRGSPALVLAHFPERLLVNSGTSRAPLEGLE